MIFSIADQASRSRALATAPASVASAFASLLAFWMPVALGSSRSAAISRSTSIRSYQISNSPFSAKPAIDSRYDAGDLPRGRQSHLLGQPVVPPCQHE